MKEMDTDDFLVLHSIFKENREEEPLLTEFLRRWLPKLVRYISLQEAAKGGMYLQAGDLEDIQLDVVMLICIKIRQIDQSSFRRWICAAIRNVARNYLRKSNRDCLIWPEHNSIYDQPSEASSGTGRTGALEAIEALTPRQQKVLELRYVYKYTSKETARLIGAKDEKQVDQWCFQAKLKMRKNMRDKKRK